MKELSLYQVDAFAMGDFSGNPAAVCPLVSWLDDELLQAIAHENNLSETAFFVPSEKGYQIRWFTPEKEISLCGHATLASAYIIANKLLDEREIITFQSLSGLLKATKKGDMFQLDFPALYHKKIECTPELIESLGTKPKEVYESAFDILCILKDEQEVKVAEPNLNLMKELLYQGVIISAKAQKTDIYSRCFYPDCSVPEDIVTGSAHCAIIPYWSKKLGQKKLHALQGLDRQGELFCEYNGNRVLLSGRCHLYFEGKIYLNNI